jgi:hypothetical protein
MCPVIQSHTVDGTPTTMVFAAAAGSQDVARCWQLSGPSIGLNSYCHAFVSAMAESGTLILLPQAPRHPENKEYMEV